jgi:OFA family oxalate/formate antiporter-like MFS transporter
MVTLSTAFGLSREFAMESAVAILTVFNITNGLSRIVTGYFSDILGRNSTMSATFFAAGCAYFVLPHVNGLMVSAILAAVAGIAFGTLFAVSAPLISDCFGLKHFGAIFGLAATGYGFVSGVIGPSLAGYILDVTEGNFVIVFTYLGFFCVLSGFFIRFVVPPGTQ